jgi:hypothetical protein
MLETVNEPPEPTYIKAGLLLSDSQVLGVKVVIIAVPHTFNVPLRQVTPVKVTVCPLATHQVFAVVFTSMVYGEPAVV